MSNEDYHKYSRLIAAIELLRFKAESQMNGTTSCVLFDRDVNEILATAGLEPLKQKDLEVI